MKQILALIVFLFGICTINAKEHIVNQPPFMAWSSTTLEIDRVTLSDTATVLHIDAFYQPNWWIKIVSDTYLLADGKKYMLKSAEGFELDKEVFMPASGTMSFQLIFPPLPKGVTEIDLIEGEEKGAFCVWGIRLDGQPIKNALTGKYSTKNEFTLETPVIKPGNARFTGQIFGYKPQMKLTATLLLPNLLLGKRNELALTVTEDGSFSIDLPVLHIQSIYIYSPFFNGRIYVKPGETTNVDINFSEICRAQSKKQGSTASLGDKYFFTGALADLNNNINNSSSGALTIGIRSQEDYDNMLNAIWKMTPEQFKSYWYQRFENSIKALDNYPELNKSTRDFMIMNGKAELAQNLLGAEWMITNAYKQHHKMERNAKLPDSILPVFTKEYYNFLPELIPNNASILYLENLNPLLLYLQEASVNNELILSADKKAEESIFAELMGTSSDKFVYNFLNITKTAISITNFTPLTNEQLTEIGQTAPEIKEYLASENNKLKQLIEENKKKTGYTVNPVDTKDIPKEELFAAITEPYRGKVIFVDFWATWCGPCLMAMKEAEPVKEELKGKDIVYLYLATENSPLKTWEQKIPDIKGEHYRVTEEQWNYWSAKFKIEGVPSYMIIGKDGNPTHFQVGFMGVEKMKELLLKELEK